MDGNDTVKVLNAKVTPMGPANNNQNLQKTVAAAQNVFNDALNGLSDEIPKSEDEPIGKAEGFLKSVIDYAKSSDFKDDINETAKKYNVPPKKLAQNMFEKALGTVGDILGIAISVICNAGRMVIKIADTVANSIVNLIESLAKGFANIITLNRTCIATA